MAPLPVLGQNVEIAYAALQAGDYDTAFREYRLAAEQGDAMGQANLGNMYRLGYGVSHDGAEAVRWYRLAAEQGDAAAQANLGTMYKLGEGVPQDAILTHMWLNLAAAN